jgi:hypothetical protein
MIAMKNTLLFKHAKLGLLLVFVLFSILGWGQVAMTITSSYTQDFNTLASTGTSIAWTDNSTITNWYSQRTGIGTTYSVDSGSSITGTHYSYGSTSATDRAIGSIGSSNESAGSFAHGVLLKNTSGATITDIKVTYTLEQWRKSGGVTANEITFYYKISSSAITSLNPNVNTTWTQVSELTLSSPVNTTTASAIDGNSTSNKTTLTNISIPSLSLADNKYIMLKWDDPDHSGFDHGISIDDVTINWTITTTKWNGASWSNGTPTTSQDAIIDGNYDTTTNGVFSAKTLTINSGKIFTINTGHNITVAGAVTNNGTFTVSYNANLVQTDLAATNLGNIIINRDSASINLYDYTLWSSPVAGQKLKAFSPDTLDTRFYTYNSSTNQYNVVPAPLTTTPFAPATGYLIRAPNNWVVNTPTTFNGIFTGVPNNGDISVSGLVSGKYYAVGNPYPSTISVASFYTANPNAGTLYFWRKTNGVTGTAYATRNNTGATASGGYTPSTDIAVGQGFFVSPSANMDLNFSNAMRDTPSTSSVFLRTTEERNRFWLNLTNTSGVFSQMLVGYLPEATSGVDNAIDGRYFNDSPIALTSIINSEEYTIQGRALPFSTTDTVPLGFKTNAAGNYTIAIDHVEGLLSTGQTVFLKDNLLNTVTDLSAGSYSFASAIGTFNSRFEVVYQSTLAVTNPTFTASSVIAFSANGEIRINSGSTIMELVRVYDLQGRLLAEKKQINASETTITTTASNQVLLVEITAANGSKITKKIIQ